MCTLTYIPTPEGKFVFTNSRDEYVSRPQAEAPRCFPRKTGIPWWGPLDPQGGGTWIGCIPGEYVVCLFNGAFQKHIPSGNYRKSRGLIVREILESENPLKAIQAISLNNIEPFTMIIAIANTEANQLFQLTWDGDRQFFEEKNAKGAHIWSSVILYDAEMCKIRHQWLKKALEEESGDRDVISFAWQFHHKYEQQHPETSILMNRVGVNTVSITSIYFDDTEENWKMRYEDIVGNQQYQISLIENSLV